MADYQMILDKATEHLAPEALKYVREELCFYCPNKKCIAGSFCSSFLMLLRAHIWEMKEEAGRWN